MPSCPVPSCFDCPLAILLSTSDYTRTIHVSHMSGSHRPAPGQPHKAPSRGSGLSGAAKRFEYDVSTKDPLPSFAIGQSETPLRINTSGQPPWQQRPVPSYSSNSPSQGSYSSVLHTGMASGQYGGEYVQSPHASPTTQSLPGPAHGSPTLFSPSHPGSPGQRTPLTYPGLTATHFGHPADYSGLPGSQFPAGISPSPSTRQTFPGQNPGVAHTSTKLDP